MKLRPLREDECFSFVCRDGLKTVDALTRRSPSNPDKTVRTELHQPELEFRIRRGVVPSHTALDTAPSSAVVFAATRVRLGPCLLRGTLPCFVRELLPTRPNQTQERGQKTRDFLGSSWAFLVAVAPFGRMAFRRSRVRLPSAPLSKPLFFRGHPECHTGCGSYPQPF
jgi:hypothetical protein